MEWTWGQGLGEGAHTEQVEGAVGPTWLLSNEVSLPLSHPSKSVWVVFPSLATRALPKTPSMSDLVWL